MKDGAARAVRTLSSATSLEPADRVVLLSAQMIGLRLKAAAEAAGIERRVTAHWDGSAWRANLPAVARQPPT